MRLTLKGISAKINIFIARISRKEHTNVTIK